MRAAESIPSRGTRRWRVRAGVGALAAAVALAACTGDNLFTGVVVSKELTGPDVTITAPTANASIAAGAGVSVTAEVTSSQGVSQLLFSSLFDDGSTAFTPLTVNLPNPNDTTVTKTLAQASTTTGSAQIIVQATDILGSTGADTVAVTIGP